MELFIRSSSFLDIFLNELSDITDKAKLLIETVDYNEIDKTVTLQIKRNELLGYKIRFWSSDRIPVYGDKLINSKIIIKNVKDCTITNIFDMARSEVLLMFGLQVIKNKIYLNSFEEIDHGETAYSIEITVHDVSIEFIDEEDLK